MSPEQVRGESLDARTDVFSLGAVLFELITGRRAFVGGTDADITAAILSSTVPGVTRLVDEAPPALERITHKCLEKDRERRYQTMRELAVDLDAVKRRLQTAGVRRVSALRWAAASVLALTIAGLSAGSLWSARKHLAVNSTPVLQYTQLTNFPDSVHSPALSPDGKMLAFVRGPQSGAGEELYLKILPDGQPRALTHDGGDKDTPTFTPDGSGVVFTDGARSSLVVPVAGGLPSLFMANASGLRWIGPGQLLFSQMKTAPNMGIVSAIEGRTPDRDVYVPASVTGMAHFSERSPGGTQVLVAEMDNAWLPCRVVPFDGSTPGTRVGPAAAECTTATWSPDGRWMYFAAAVKGESHLWRQRFPDGSPEQLTFGPNQERGIAVDPDGRSVITAVGAMQSTVWYHDEHGDRQVSVEGYAYRPLVSPDESKLFYMVRRAAKRSFSSGELWAADLATGRNERLLPDFLIRSYHVSQDGKFIVFDSFDERDRSGVWLATTDRSQAPRRLTPDGSVEEQRPFFGASGDIYFMQEQSQGLPALYRMKPDGSGRQKISEAIDFLVNISPDEKWAVLWSFHGTSLFPLAGGASHLLCSSCSMGPIVPDSPGVSWSSDGKTMFVNVGHGNNPTGTMLIPWQGVESLPISVRLSPAGLATLRGARSVPESSIAPGRTAARYAFARRTEQSNLYRIRLP